MQHPTTSSTIVGGGVISTWNPCHPCFDKHIRHILGWSKIEVIAVISRLGIQHPSISEVSPGAPDSPPDGGLFRSKANFEMVSDIARSGFFWVFCQATPTGPRLFNERKGTRVADRGRGTGWPDGPRSCSRSRRKPELQGSQGVGARAIGVQFCVSAVPSALHRCPRKLIRSERHRSGVSSDPPQLRCGAPEVEVVESP